MHQSDNFQVDEKFTELFSLHEPTETITAIEGQDGHMIRLCSTSRLLWIDHRFPKKPLLGYQHNRRYDRTLESRTLRLGQGRSVRFIASSSHRVT